MTMKSLLKFLMIAVLFAGSLSWATPASACSCVQSPGVTQELERSDAVFSGKVIEIDEKPRLLTSSTRSIVFQVAQVWKGDGHSQVEISTGQGGGDCGFEFNMGQEYLVYAVKSNMYGTNELITIICDRTAVLSQAQGDVAVLGEGQAPSEEVDLLSQNGWLLPVIGFIVLAIIVFTVYRRKKIK